MYAALRPWLTNNGPLARRLAAALYDTARWVNAHRPETAVIETKFTKLPIETTTTMARNVFGTNFDPRLIQPVLDIGYRYQLTDRQVQAAEISFAL